MRVIHCFTVICFFHRFICFNNLEGISQLGDRETNPSLLQRTIYSMSFHKLYPHSRNHINSSGIENSPGIYCETSPHLLQQLIHCRDHSFQYYFIHSFGIVNTIPSCDIHPYYAVERWSVVLRYR
jgi:hypothetical protein